MTSSTKPDLVEARYRARLVCKALNISSPADIILEDIAMARGVYVTEGRLDGAEARLVRKGNRGLVRLKADLPEAGRRRFAVAHELGHWEMHGGVSPVVLCTSEDIAAYGSSAREIEANAFAGELLMPTLLVRPRCDGITPHLDAIRAVAEEFRTTLTAAAVRFVEESREICVVVFSVDRKVKWWRASERARIWIEPGWEVDQRSSAWDGHEYGYMEPVPTQAWFPDPPSGVQRRVVEQTLRLGRYNTVLTLLWVTDEDDDPDEG
jgi:Zn-dependent peptidase ImmA (M78 family)